MYASIHALLTYYVFMMLILITNISSVLHTMHVLCTMCIMVLNRVPKWVPPEDLLNAVPSGI